MYASPVLSEYLQATTDQTSRRELDKEGCICLQRSDPKTPILAVSVRPVLAYFCAQKDRVARNLVTYVRIMDRTLKPTNPILGRYEAGLGHLACGWPDDLRRPRKICSGGKICVHGDRTLPPTTPFLYSPKIGQRPKFC